MTRDHALQLLDDLVRWWQAAYGALTDSETDLMATRRFFDPVAAGRRLRAAIDGVSSVDPPSGPLPAPLALPLPGGRWLVTPDGRLAIDLLSEALGGIDDPVVIEPIGLIAAERRLLDIYRSWGRHRLDQVVKLQTGEDRPLQIGPIALGLVLLVNRSTEESRALPCGPDDPLRAVVDAAIFPPVRAFEAVLQPSATARPRAETRAADKESLAGGWMPPELYRRFPFAIREPRKNEPQLLWVRAEGSERLLAALATELARRAGVTREAIGDAFDQLVEVLRENGPALAAHGFLHERSLDTKNLRGRLLDLVDGQSAQ